MAGTVVPSAADISSVLPCAVANGLVTWGADRVWPGAYGTTHMEGKSKSMTSFKTGAWAFGSTLLARTDNPVSNAAASLTSPVTTPLATAGGGVYTMVSNSLGPGFAFASLSAIFRGSGQRTGTQFATNLGLGTATSAVADVVTSSLYDTSSGKSQKTVGRRRANAGATVLLQPSGGYTSTPGNPY